MLRALTILFLFLLTAPVGAAPAFADADADVRAVYQSMQARLRLMPDVAAWKYARNAPVVDPERERQVLDATVRQATDLGIDGESARRLFSLQIRLAVRVQESLIAEWRAGASVPQDVRDLATELRPQLDRIGTELLQAIYLALPALQQQDFAAHYASHARIVDAPGLTDADRSELTQALATLRPAPGPALNRIRASHVLRIGMTGDYEPFSVEEGRAARR